MVGNKKKSRTPRVAMVDKAAQTDSQALSLFRLLPPPSTVKAGRSNILDRSGVTVLHLAADNGSVESVRTLIKSGADVNVKTKSFNPRKRKRAGDWGALEIFNVWERRSLYDGDSTPLHLAARKNHLQCVRLLLDHGASVNALDCRQQSPMFLAAQGGHPECLTMMLQRSGGGPELCRPTDIQDTTLLQCIRHGDKMRECIRELVYRGADVGHRMNGNSAVHEALHNGLDMDIVQMLIMEGRGIDFNRTGGGSPLLILMDRQLLHYRDGVEANPPDYTAQDENTALLLLRMGVTQSGERRKQLWQELNLPKRPGVLLETVMDSFTVLPPLSELEADVALRPLFMQLGDFSDTLWEIPVEGISEEAFEETDEILKLVVAQKKDYYQQRSKEMPSLAHLSRSAIRSHLQADVRKVISWPVLQTVKRYILLDHNL